MAIDGGTVTDIAAYRIDRAVLGVIEIRGVQRANRHFSREQETDEIDPEKTGAAPDQVRGSAHV